MNIEIVGGGSIGLLLMGKLLPIHPELRIITRTREQSECLRSSGLYLHEKNMENGYAVQHAYSQEQFMQGNLAAWPSPDWILLTVKQRSINNDLMNLLSSRIGTKTSIICFQNGLGHLEKLAANLPNVPLYSAVTTEGAKKTELNHVSHTGIGVTSIGRVDLKKENDEEVLDNEKKLVESMEKAGFSTILSKDIRVKIWSKLIINSVINPLTSILKLQNGQLLEQQATMKLMRSLYEEAEQVAFAEGIETPIDLWEQILTVCNKTSSNYSSMLQDLQRGSITEIDAINGSIIKYAESHNIPVMTHRTVYEMVLALQGFSGKSS